MGEQAVLTQDLRAVGQFLNIQRLNFPSSVPHVVQEVPSASTRADNGGSTVTWTVILENHFYNLGVAEVAFHMPSQSIGIGHLMAEEAVEAILTHCVTTCEVDQRVCLQADATAWFGHFTGDFAKMK